MTNGRAVIYIRVSTDKQAEQGVSLDVQEQRCRQYAKEKGWTVERVFPDEGESAKAANRPRLMEMLNHIAKHKGKINNLIVYKVDRLSRNSDDQYAIMYKLSQAKVTLTSATEEVGNNATGRLTRNIMFALAEFDNAVKSDRVRDCMLQVFHDGYWPFQPPTGYVKNRDKVSGRPLPLPHAEYGPMLRWAAERRAKGDQYASIARQLNTRGFKTSMGKSVNPQTLMRAMENKFYYGQLTAFGETVQGRHTPLFSRDLYLEVAIMDERLARPKIERLKHNPDFPLLHSVTCLECGKPLRGSWPRSKSGKHYAYYHHYRADCELSRSVTREKVHESFLQLLGGLKPDKRVLNLFRAVILEVAKSKSHDQVKSLEHYKSQLKKLIEQRDKLIEFKINDPKDEMISKEDYLLRKNAIEQQIEAVEAERVRNSTRDIDITKYLDRCFETLADPAKRWESLPTVEAKAKLTAAIFPNGVTFDGKRIGTPYTAPIFEIAAKSIKKQSLVIPSGVEPEFHG